MFMGYRVMYYHGFPLGYAISIGRCEMGFFIRKAEKGDEVSLAYIQTESWKTAFKGILSDEMLEQCTEMDRVTRMYKRLLDEHKGNGYILEVDEKPHCIAWWDRSRTESMSEHAELICIHSLQDKWRNGYGSKLMNRIESNSTEF